MFHGCCLHSSSDRAHWTDSHSPYHVMDPGTRIAFKLHSPSDVGVPDRFLSVKPYTCGPEKGPLPPSLAGRTVLNFTASIATDLRIVHVGDSLGQQFAQGFDATALSDGADGNRRVLAEYFYEGRVYSHNCLSVAAPVRGGSSPGLLFAGQIQQLYSCTSTGCLKNITFYFVPPTTQRKLLVLNLKEHRELS